MMIFQDNKKKEERQLFIINGRLFFANLLTTFKNLFEAGARCLKGSFCICGIKGQSAMEYFAIIFSVLILAAIGAHEFFNQTKVSGNTIYQKALDRMTITGLKASSTGHLLWLDCDGISSNGYQGAQGISYNEETGVPSGTYDGWFTESDHMSNIACRDYNNWFTGTYSSGNNSRYWFNLAAPDGRTGFICLTVTGNCSTSPVPGPTLPAQQDSQTF